MVQRKNELLEEDIARKIEKVRYEKPKKEDKRYPIFYIFLTLLVTIGTLISVLSAIKR